jgi:hypothetical protein
MGLNRLVPGLDGGDYRLCQVRGLRVEASWCAWQESNLLPLAPQASALSGELQARERFSLGERRQPQSRT